MVTGASGGVGRATAIALADRGFDVTLMAGGRAGLEAAARQAEAHGGRALIVPTDVADFDTVDRAVSMAEDRSGRSTSGSTTP